jgi:diketogulonate reductase-like aldo/keto reductase
LDRGRLSSLDKSSLNLLSEIVQSHHATIYQILLAWSIRDGNTIAISKSSNQEHIISNVQSATIKLMNNELIEIDKLFKKPITKTTLALW